LEEYVPSTVSVEEGGNMLFQESLNSTELNGVTSQKIKLFISFLFVLGYMNRKIWSIREKEPKTHEARRGYYRRESLH